MTAKSIMNPNPIVLHPTDKIRTAADFIMEHRFRSIPVVTEDGRFIGMFGINCLLRSVFPPAVVMEDGLRDVSFIREGLRDLHRRFTEVEDETVGMCINHDVTVVYPDTPLMETLLILYQTRASLPVVDRDTNQLVGMISYYDVGKRILDAEI